MTGNEDLKNILEPGDVASHSSLLVFSQHNSNRLEYVCEFIFKQVLKINFRITNDQKEFEASDIHKINYSGKEFSGAFQILPAGLLFESTVTEEKPEAKIKNEVIYFYENGNGNTFHFDIFSAVFYFISRYEEWQNFNKDQHKRFELKESLLFKYNCHLKPVVEIWIGELERDLQERYPELQFPGKEFKTIATIDVDNLFAYKNKGFVRSLGAAIKDVLKFDFKNLARRIKSISGSANDPFDIYDTFSAFCKENNIPLIYFFLFRTGTPYDRTVNPQSEIFRHVFEVIKKNNGAIGLHPSYFSSEDPEVLKKEVENFSERSGADVKRSRQHYLKFDIRSTPKLLLENKIKTDFSMGFASGTGFRAGTTHPFYYYDFNAEEKTYLLFVPFCAMDGAYFVYNSVSAEEAYRSLLKMKEEIKKVNGLFVTVFHERTFAAHLYPGFGEMYKKVLLS